MGNRINFDLTFFYKIFASKYLCLGLFVVDMICYSIFFTTSIEFFCWFGIFLAIVTAVEILLFGYFNKSNKGKYKGKHYRKYRYKYTDIKNKLSEVLGDVHMVMQVLNPAGQASFYGYTDIYTWLKYILDVYDCKVECDRGFLPQDVNIVLGSVKYCCVNSGKVTDDAYFVLSKIKRLPKTRKDICMLDEITVDELNRSLYAVIKDTKVY